MTSPATQARSLYRRFLRELPSRTPSLLANPSPIQQHVRADFAATAPTPSSSTTPDSDSAQAPLSANFRAPDTAGSSSLRHQLQKPAEQRLEEAQQYIHYLRAQREYLTLLERYNPGVNFSEEERLRLTARRVGMNLPLEFSPEGKKE
ncbi:hypothetical protein B0A55_06285 [Friedmanniomyces simplex]|uniref:Ras guanyl-nucleotide exchange factor RasGEF n=1 Tax=Friedmanniomyces simplex TaxID=329884 RepID=A0A4V5NFX6_9PEZI|nr:hypothetical protein B0A55_06285 [Friedmanniomyces simplex]